MKTKIIKNQQMGYLPTEIDRSIFQKRIEMLNTLHPIAQAIVLDFENYFIGNENVGYSYATLFKRALDSHKALLGDKTITAPVQTVFDTSMIKQGMSMMGKLNVGSFYNKLWNAPSMVILDIINNSFATPTKLNDPYIIYSNKDLVMPTVKEFDPSITTTPYTYFEKAESYPYEGPTTWYQNQMIYGVGDYGTSKVGIFYEDVTKLLVNTLGLTRITVATKNYNATSKSYFWTFSNYYNVTTLSISKLISIFESALTMIQWLESENNAIEIRGNVDGVKIDGYEKILLDQMNYINNITDVVQSSLINEKIEFQKQKDATLLLIEQKKKEIEMAKLAKKESIVKMNDFVTNYQTILQTKKDEIVRRVIQ